jgi:[acyl-carrier-protein] S-malonyltransferase
MTLLQTSALSRVAFVFPGQGSQYPGMIRDLGWCGEQALRAVSEATELTGLPIEELMTRADAVTLADPEIAQLVVFVHSCVQLRALRTVGLTPTVVAGHSLGEYTALVACGCLEWTGALRLVAARGRAMAQAARERPGAMAALVGLDQATVRQLCAAAGTGAEQVVVANLNSPKQAVVSGTERAVAAVVDAARTAGALRAKRLPVGGAYHSPLMAPAQAALAPLLRAATLHAPDVAMVSSVTGAAVTDVDAYRQALVEQITSPVRWERAVRALAEGPKQFVEVGPGRVLTGLDREMVRDAAHRTAAQARGAALAAPPDGKAIR